MYFVFQVLLLKQREIQQQCFFPSWFSSQDTKEPQNKFIEGLFSFMLFLLSIKTIVPMLSMGSFFFHGLSLKQQRNMVTMRSMDSSFHALCLKEQNHRVAMFALDVFSCRTFVLTENSLYQCFFTSSSSLYANFFLSFSSA